MATPVVNQVRRLPRFGVVDGELVTHVRGTVIRLDDVLALLDQPASKPDDAGGIDVERLARAIHSMKVDASVDLDPLCRETAGRIAAAYARLTNPEDQG